MLTTCCPPSAAMLICSIGTPISFRTRASVSIARRYRYCTVESLRSQYDAAAKLQRPVIALGTLRRSVETSVIYAFSVSELSRARSSGTNRPSLRMSSSSKWIVPPPTWIKATVSTWRWPTSRATKGGSDAAPCIVTLGPETYCQCDEHGEERRS